MKKQTQFRPYNPNQAYLLPPSLQEWLSEDHLVYYLMDVVSELDLRPIVKKYDRSQGGQPAYNPEMMVGLLLYAYCVGLPSSRKIERATYESVPFRIVAANQHPDHDTIADFRKRHLEELSGLFVQVLRLCQKAKLVKLGHVSLDGTKIKANASKHKAMSYARMEKTATELEQEVKRLLEEAERVDNEEDARYGKKRRGDELPEELRYKKSRLKKIREAMQALEDEAKQKAEMNRAEYEAKRDDWEKRNRKGRRPQAPSDRPEAKSQKNFTDPESRIMRDSATKSYEQSYNAQATVDKANQVIVSSHVTQSAVDSHELQPSLERLKENTGGKVPRKFSSDAGYWSEHNANYLEAEKIDAYIATKKGKHSKTVPRSPRGRIPQSATKTDRMTRKVQTIRGRCTYTLRKQIVEPVFGYIKEVRGFRRFSLRGFKNVGYEWDMICLTHNILKLFHSQVQPGMV